MNLFSNTKRVQLVAAAVLLGVALVWVVYEALVRPRLSRPLAVAAAAGDQAAVRHLLWWGADVNAETPDLGTPLIAVVRQGNIETTVLLLDHGAKVNALDDLRNLRSTALSTAVTRGDLAMIRLLLERGASLRGDAGRVALNLAVENGNLAVAQLLLNQGVYPDARVLGEAAAQGRLDVIQLLLNQGANAANENELGQTALMLISAEFHPTAAKLPPLDYGAVVDLLVARGANVNAQDRSGRTALLFAAQKGNTVLVRALLRHGADVNIKADAGWTALNRAAEHPDVADLLKKAGAQR